MSAGPLPSEQLAAIEQFAQAVTVAWGSRRPDVSDFLSTAADHGARIARDHVPALIAEIGWLAAELADEKAVHAKTVDNFETVLGLAEGESLTVWRAEFGPIALGMYIAREEAQAHCASHYRDFSGDGRLSWYEEEPVEDSTLRMYADGINEGTELETVYLVVPVPLMAAFDPDGDE